MEKWEDRRDSNLSRCVWLEGWKTFLYGWEEKWEDRKQCLYKNTHMSLLKMMPNQKKKKEEKKEEKEKREANHQPKKAITKFI